MIEAMNHVSLTVNNLDQAIAFYSDVLGMELVSKAYRDEEFSSAVTGIKGVELYIAYMSAPGTSIELIEYTKGAGVKLDTTTNNIGSAHICFNISDYDAWMERMERNHVALRGELCMVPAGPNKGKRVCYAMDMDGNNLEFIESK